ncbi:homoserine dehydrogenase [Alkalibacterium sp. m-11]
MKVAILGLGTVGSGVLKVIQENQTHIHEQIGEPLEVTHVFGETLLNLHNCDLSEIKHVKTIDALLDEEFDVAVEVLGGIEFTYDVHKKLLNKGVHVVSANKDMLALHIDELAEIANENQVQLSYEATSAGGVPIIHNLLYTLRANKLSRVLGILNGTTNYILTKMTQEGMDFDQALEEASQKGYAEADPTNDVDGFDAQRKITLLSRLAYNRRLTIEEVPVQGIREVAVEDIDIGLQHGYVMKLLGLSEFDGEHLEISVQPTFLPENHQLAAVHDAMNAVFVNGNAVGETMFYGPGAGSLETASAIVADIIEIAQFGYKGNLTPNEEAKITDTFTEHPYYVRFNDSADQAKKVLDELNILYEAFEGNHAFAVQTVPLNNEEKEVLLEKAEVGAIYRITREGK